MNPLSGRWAGPLYVTVSVLLAFLAITTAFHSAANKATSPATTKPTGDQLCLNASRALRRSGFAIMAMFLHIAPEIFFEAPNATIFAMKDPSLLANTTTSLPPWFLKRLLQYHTSPLRLPFSKLLNLPQGSCFPTVLAQKNLAMTKSNKTEKSVEINRVMISHPDMFLAKNLVIHGVEEPFSLVGPQDIYNEINSIRSPICNASSTLILGSIDPKNTVEWSRIVRALSSNGLVSFAIGLNSVLDGIVNDYKNLTSLTIFAPPELEFVASPSPVLDKIVRLHILSRRVDYKELASLPDGFPLKTLVPGQDLEISGANASDNATRKLAVDGVEIVAPELLSSGKFVVHEISRRLELGRLPSSWR